MNKAQPQQAFLITVWDQPDWPMLNTSHGIRVTNYLEWCEAEVRRIRRLGSPCHVGTLRDGRVAVIRGEL